QSFRTYALDFWGFGDSGKKRKTYAVQDFISLVDQFMEQLGISQAPLVGHSMGGTVSLSVAVQYPQRASKVVVIGSPVMGSSLSLLLKLFGRRPIGYMTYHNLWAFKYSYRLLAPLYSRDPHWAEMMDRDISKLTLESFQMSIASLRLTDLRTSLSRVRVPVMGMYGDRDIVVSPDQWKPLQRGVPNARIERFNKAGHFIMLDEPRTFVEKLQNFLNSEKKTDD
ncbi:MAG: alpha/beta fold hydrolase, partial [Omnitrophica WOR_2 bacterium]